MSLPAPGPLKKTPLNARHRSLGARMVEFGGWDMPVEYSGIVDEHMAVRTRAGLFDVSHMGEIEIAGADALKAVQHITSNDAAKLTVGQIQYSALTTPQGTFVDDVLVYKLADEHFMLVVNASNIIKDYHWITEHIADQGDAVAVNTSSRYALLALQGPAARDVLQSLTAVNLDGVKYYWFTTGEVASVRCTISRTGYIAPSLRSRQSWAGDRRTTARGLVLVVEDERPIADLVRLYLTRDGFGVHVERDGAAGLAAARRLRPVACVLDIGAARHRRHRDLPAAARRAATGRR